MSGLVNSLGALWSLGLWLAAIATLLWFLYWFLLRRLVRARRIAAARERRMLREAAQRESGDVHVN